MMWCRRLLLLVKISRSWFRIPEISPFFSPDFRVNNFPRFFPEYRFSSLSLFSLLISLTLSLSHSLTLSLSLSHSHSLTHSLTLSLSLSLTHSHSLSHSLSLSLSLSLTLSLTLSLSHSLTLSLSPIQIKTDPIRRDVFQFNRATPFLEAILDIQYVKFISKYEIAGDS